MSPWRDAKQIATNPGGYLWKKLAKPEHQNKLKGVKRKIAAFEILKKIGGVNLKF